MQKGLLTFTPGSTRSIVLADRLANCSDAELERAALQRGGRVIWSDLPALAYAHDVATCGMETDRELVDLLDRIAGN